VSGFGVDIADVRAPVTLAHVAPTFYVRDCLVSALADIDGRRASSRHNGEPVMEVGISLLSGPGIPGMLVSPGLLVARIRQTGVAAWSPRWRRNEICTG
jgi:hypothetical protein